MMWTLYSLVGIIVAIFTYIAVDYLTINKHRKKFNFSKEEEKVKKTLTQKKEAYEKEMTAEIQSAIEEKRQQLHTIDKEYWDKFQSYGKNIAKLDRDYQATRDQYEEMDRIAEEKRQQENAEIIAAAAREREQKIASINAQYEKDKDAIKANFQTFSDEINLKKAALTEEIKAFEEKQTKIIERLRKDEELREERDFYHITLSSVEKSDIEKLKAMAPGFSRPEIFYKILYETYYKAKMEEMFKRVLTTEKNSGGIYKITNINNEKVYVGKTTDFISRWRIHAKRGCNIERIAGQIYEAMFQEGLENFTFEIIEICSKEEQTSREKYWIEFYHSDQYGYNIRKG